MLSKSQKNPQKRSCTNARISHAEEGNMRDTLSFTRSFPISRFTIKINKKNQFFVSSNALAYFKVLVPYLHAYLHAYSPF